MRKIIISGNLTADATIYTPQNSETRACINFTVAVNERFLDKQGNKNERAYFFTCAYWKEKGKTKLAEYLKKGIYVVVEGVPDIHAYTDKEGKNVSQMKIEVKEIELGQGQKKENQSNDNTNSNTTTPNNNNGGGNSNQDNNDNLPF